MLDRQTLINRLTFIRQGSEVERFHTKRMIQRNDVGHHSFHVAWLAYIMAIADGIPPERVVMAALAHDLAEHITGDVPGNFKRYMGLGDQFNAYENTLFADVGFSFNEQLTEDEARIVNMADMMEGAFFAISEASLGNRRIGVVFRNYRAYMRKMEPFSEVETLILSYIDELWAHYGRLLDSSQQLGHCPGWASEDKEDTVSLWTCPEHGLYGGQVDCPRCGKVGDYATVAEPQGSDLVDILRKEEAEGRATPPPSASISKPPIPGAAQVPEQPADDPVDDRAQPDLGTGSPLPANARQHGGDHYKGTGYEHWDLVLDTGQSYLQGCATKYVTRARKHSGGPRINLLKAIHYIDKAEEAVGQGRLKLEGAYSVSDVHRFGFANDLHVEEVQIIKDIIGGRWAAARQALEHLLETYPQEESAD